MKTNSIVIGVIAVIVIGIVVYGFFARTQPSQSTGTPAPMATTV